MLLPAKTSSKGAGSLYQQGFIYDFSKKGWGGGGWNHLTPPTYQVTVPITNALAARIRLWKNSRCFLNSCIPFCCNRCHFAAVYALKPPYITCADSKGGRNFRKGGGSPPSPSPPPPPPPYEFMDSVLGHTRPRLQQMN